jgi:hypothetical protein
VTTILALLGVCVAVVLFGWLLVVVFQDFIIEDEYLP